MKLRLFVLFSFLAFASTLGITVAYLLMGSSSGAPLDLIVQKGASIHQVASNLHAHKVIENPTFFKAFLKLTQGEKRVRAGEFRFTQGMRPLDALRVLYFSDPILHKVTFPEGWTLAQLASKLAEEGLVNQSRFLELTNHPAAAQKYRLRAPSLEGFLFPDTYYFSRLDSEEKIVDSMVRSFFKTYRRYEKEAQQKGFSVEELVTLASIIEKETGAPEERPLISSVFQNRLQKKMRLQSDPTTIYGIKNFNGNLTKKDLKTTTPYNTYRIDGLPIGPIANPGEKALLATLRPAETDYLYFVSNNNGTHIFSETYREHVNHVNNYQKNIRNRRQKASQ